MTLSEQETLELRYLAKAGRPLWGGHLGRGEPLNDPNMRRWLELGLITQVGTQGYILTDRGHREIVRSDPLDDLLEKVTPENRHPES